MPPPLPPCCLINYTKRSSPPLPRGGELICTVLNFFCLYPNINLKLPSHGSNPCLLLSHHAALSTRPTRPPLPLTPRWRGHMYYTPFPNLFPNITLHLPPPGIESVPPPLLPRCLINQTNQTSRPPYPNRESSYVLYSITFVCILT